MKTTIELPDALFSDAKALARANGTTLRALVEQGLQKVLADLREPKPFVLKDGSFRGNGLQPGQENLDWPALRAMIYEGHGG